MVKLPQFVKNRVAVAFLSLSLAGAGGIIVHEGMVPKAYRDPVGVVTVCAGHTATARMGQVKTPAECSELLRQDTRVAEATVKRLVTVPVTQHQYDALVSFTFNVGSGNLAKSTLLKKLNNHDCVGASTEFLKWDYAKGIKLAGLTTRRIYESKQFITGC
jgi:lysozyme